MNSYLLSIIKDSNQVKMDLEEIESTTMTGETRENMDKNSSPQHYSNGDDDSLVAPNLSPVTSSDITVYHLMTSLVHQGKYPTS